MMLNMIRKITMAARRQAAFRACCLFVGLAGCKPVGPPPDETLARARGEVLAAAADCEVEKLRAFASEARALETAVKALEQGPSPATTDAARAAWRSASNRWAELDAMQVGPAAISTQPGGMDLRDQIFSWPLASRCAVEELLVAKGYEAGVGGQLVNRRGLYALEVLLFDEGAATACPSTSPIVSSGSWAALTVDERDARRRAYAAKVASDVVARADALLGAWEGGFAETLKTAGPGNAVFPTAQKALNALSDAAFYLDAMILNFKLGPPLGLTLDCGSPPCPELLESGLAAQAKRSLHHNLIGARNLVLGCQAGHAGPGLDELLEVKGAGEVGVRLKERFDGAQAALDAIEEGDLAVALVQDRPSVQALFDAIRGINTVLKTETITVLDLELPRSLEGDND